MGIGSEVHRVDDRTAFEAIAAHHSVFRYSITPGLPPKNWSIGYESLRRPEGPQEALDESETAFARADRAQAARGGRDAYGWQDRGPGLPSLGGQRGDIAALAEPVRRHEGSGGQEA